MGLTGGIGVGVEDRGRYPWVIERVRPSTGAIRVLRKPLIKMDACRDALKSEKTRPSE